MLHYIQIMQLLPDGYGHHADWNLLLDEACYLSNDRIVRYKFHLTTTDPSDCPFRAIV